MQAQNQDGGCGHSDQGLRKDSQGDGGRNHVVLDERGLGWTIGAAQHAAKGIKGTAGYTEDIS